MVGMAIHYTCVFIYHKIPIVLFLTKFRNINFVEDRKNKSKTEFFVKSSNPFEPLKICNCLIWKNKFSLEMYCGLVQFIFKDNIFIVILEPYNITCRRHPKMTSHKVCMYVTALSKVKSKMVIFGHVLKGHVLNLSVLHLSLFQNRPNRGCKICSKKVKKVKQKSSKKI